MKTLIASVALLAFSGTAMAGDMVIGNVHLCCGACVKAVNKALPTAKVDAKAKTVTVAVDDAEAASKALATLAEAGFAGEAKFAGKPVALPDAGVKKGVKADSATFTGVHLCCGACVKGVNKVLPDAKVNSSAGTITVDGGDVDVYAVYQKLVGAGFYGKLEK